MLLLLSRIKCSVKYYCKDHWVKDFHIFIKTVFREFYLLFGGFQIFVNLVLN